MVFVIAWLFDHFTLKPVPSVNGVWIITFVNQLHVWVTKFKPSFMFFQLLVLTLNNVIWMNFFAALFDETQHVVKTSAAGCVPVFSEVINLFIERQNFSLMFFICRLKGFYLIATACDGLLMLSLDLFNPFIKSTWYDVFQDVFLKRFDLVFSRVYVYGDIKSTSQQNENIMVLSIFPRGVHTVDSPFSLEEDPRSYIFF